MSGLTGDEKLVRLTFTKEVEVIVEAVSTKDLKKAAEQACDDYELDQLFPDASIYADWRVTAEAVPPRRRTGVVPSHGMIDGRILPWSAYCKAIEARRVAAGGEPAHVPDKNQLPLPFPGELSETVDLADIPSGVWGSPA